MCCLFKFNKNHLLFFFLMISICGNAQQHPMYTQYMFNMMNINPAYAGATGVSTVTALYRNQWIDMPGAPQNASLAFDMPINEKKIGVGVQLFNEKMGIEKSTGFNLVYAFRIPVSSTAVLSLGLQGGVVNYTANYTDVRTFQSNDPTFNQYINGLLPAAAAGIYYNNEKFYIGFSTPALLKTKISLDNRADVSTATGNDLHLFLASGYILEVNENVIVKPSLLLKAVSGAPFEFDFNASVLLEKKLSVGMSYRTGDAIVGMVELQIGKQLQLGYAFDKTTTNLATYNRGSHEIMLRYGLNKLLARTNYVQNQ